MLYYIQQQWRKDEKVENGINSSGMANSELEIVKRNLRYFFYIVDYMRHWKCKNYLYILSMKKYQRIVFGIIMFFFFVLLTVYTTYGIQDLFPQAGIIRLYIYQCRGIWTISLTLLAMIFFTQPHHKISSWQIFLINSSFVIMIAQVIYSFFLILNDILYSVFAVHSIRLNLIWFLLGAWFILISIYGSKWWKYRYTTHRQTLYFEDLPDAFDGVKIVQISDVHSGSFNNKKAVEAWIELIKKHEADIFVFTGDLVNNDAHEFTPWKDVFNGITAPLGQYSILWNHDYWDYVAWQSDQHKKDNMTLLKQHHKDLGWRLLLDEHIVIEKGWEKIILAWVENRGDSFSRYGDLNKALDGIELDKFTVLLSHDPSHWTKQIKKHTKHVHLTLAGHTHGMQLWFDFSRFKRSPIKYRYKQRAWLYSDANKHLYVNRWFGFLGLSARVGMWPEITVIELKKKKKDPL